jgi:hypothetical protein
MRLATAVASVASVAFLVVGVASAAAHAPAPACANLSTPWGVGPKATTAYPANPFGSNVTIFNPSESVTTINAALNASYTPSNHQFFFLPGTYGSAADANTQVEAADSSSASVVAAADAANIIQAPVASNSVIAGVGESPCDVVINGALDIVNDGLGIRPSQLENMTINPIEVNTPGATGVVPLHTMLFATSQTAVWRRVNLEGNVQICNLQSPMLAAGAQFANSNITGQVENCNGANISDTETEPAGYGQKQTGMWYFQDSDIGGFSGYGGIMDFVGVRGAPAENFGPATSSRPGGDIANIPAVPVVREAPFVYVENGQFYVFNPSVQYQRAGYDWSLVGTGSSLPLRDFYLANATTDTAATLNTALSDGEDVMLEPGSYTMNAALTVPHRNEVVVGLGFATLLANNDTPTLVVNDAATGAVLSGFNANGPKYSATSTGPFPSDQIVIGNTANATGSAVDPTTLTDVSFASNATTGEVINQNDVLQNQGEWQSDNNGGGGYTATTWGYRDSDYGMVVNGNAVTLEGGWLEHFKMTDLSWNGQAGRLIFMWNEQPYQPYYSPPSQINEPDPEWQLGVPFGGGVFEGYPSLSVAPNVRSFTADGFASLNRFLNGCDCVISALITTPNARHITFRNVMTLSVPYPVPCVNDVTGASESKPPLGCGAGYEGATFDYNPTSNGGLPSTSQEYSADGYYDVGGAQYLFGIDGPHGMTGAGPSALIPDVAPGLDQGPGGTSELPYSDAAYYITTRLNHFGGGLPFWPFGPFSR